MKVFLKVSRKAGMSCNLWKARVVTESGNIYRKPAIRFLSGKHSYPWLICFLLSYVSSFFLSGASAPSLNLDPSYQAVLEYARLHGFQFGTDIVFTFGPYGFLNTETGSGMFPYYRMVSAVVWSGMVAWSATGLAQSVSGPVRYIFLIWFFVYSNIGGLEQHIFLVLLYGCLHIMLEAQKYKAATATFLFVFAQLALVKFNFFIAATAGVVLCISVHCFKRNYMTSVFLLTSFSLAFILSWLAAGQQMANVYPWIRGSLEITGGYTEAMTIFPKIKVLSMGVAAGSMFLASLILIVATVRLSPDKVGILAVIVIYEFILWKHGFVRGDGHVMGFIFLMPLTFAALFLDMLQQEMGRELRRVLFVLFMAAIVFCNWAADFQEPGSMLTRLLGWPQRMVDNSRLIVSMATGNWKNCFEALRDCNKLRPAPDLHVARTLIGRSTVDVINYSQWSALSNKLNFKPRPVIQGYSAYTPYLQRLNLAFYQNGKRPQYVLFKMETIDGRFPSLDDAALLPFILDCYKPVAVDGEYLVLQTVPKAPKSPAWSLVSEQRVSFDQLLDISAFNKQLLIMQVELKPTLFGRVLKLFFQSPVLTLNINPYGVSDSYRFIPAMAAAGFVINPLFSSNSDIVSYYNGKPVSGPDSISIHRPSTAMGLFAESFIVRFYRKSS